MTQGRTTFHSGGLAKVNHVFPKIDELFVDTLLNSGFFADRSDAGKDEGSSLFVGVGQHLRRRLWDAAR